MVTNLQLLLTIGIPSLLVILTWSLNNTRISAHDKRFDELASSFHGLASRFNDVIAAQHKDALEIMRNMTALHLALFQSNRAR